MMKIIIYNADIKIWQWSKIFLKFFNTNNMNEYINERMNISDRI